MLMNITVVKEEHHLNFRTLNMVYTNRITYTTCDYDIQLRISWLFHSQTLNTDTHKRRRRTVDRSGYFAKYRLARNNRLENQCINAFTESMEALSGWFSNIDYSGNLKLSIENQSSKLSQIRYDLTCVACSGRNASHKREIISRDYQQTSRGKLCFQTKKYQ